MEAKIDQLQENPPKKFPWPKIFFLIFLSRGNVPAKYHKLLSGVLVDPELTVKQEGKTKEKWQTRRKNLRFFEGQNRPKSRTPKSRGNTVIRFGK